VSIFHTLIGPEAYERSSELMNLFEKMQTQFYQDILKKFTSQDFTAAGSTDGATVTAELNTIGNEDATHAAGLDVCIDPLLWPISLYGVSNTLIQSLLQGAGQVALTCQFNLAGAEKDAATALTNARVIKQVVASTYVGIMNTIGNAGDLTQVNSQATVDSRHQSTLSILNGASGSPQAFETPILASEGQTILSNILTGCNTGIQCGLSTPDLLVLFTNSSFIAFTLSANPPLQITNTGLVTTGTKLTFSSTTGSGTTNTSNALTSSTTVSPT
jgi:hypothetical protein